ncbi:hypothetical protein SSU93_07870 [Enterococcus avium]|nr:hypothetical protein [Enterococcus avium]MDY6440953.1 hypothetical protein [Enterococcus avium]MDY6446672.1 hypothetical protein [Enterococcus avium]MDY6453183.1 hypothetical protein [Enterococcus avium]MDY6473170.1 hypothetical protein [Enterococcus avium]
MEKAQVAYTTENEVKFARKVERSFKTAFHEIVEANQEYRELLDQDQLLSSQQHLTYQANLIDSVIATIREYPDMQLIRVELAGSWPVFQTEAGRLDLGE